MNILFTLPRESMKKPTISDNLRHLLKMHDELSISELSRQTKIPQPTLHHLLSGATKKPRKSVLETLASFFSISIPQLTGAIPLHANIPDSIKKSLGITTIPVIGWDMVIPWPQHDKAAQPLTELILDREVDEKSYALIMKDSSMQPVFPENAILIFDPAKIAKDREFVLVHLVQENSLIFNRLFIENSELFVKQEQPDGNMRLIKIKPGVDVLLATLIEVRLQF